MFTVLAAREAKIKNDVKKISDETEAGKKHHDRRCIACNHRKTKSATVSTSERYPVQGAGPQTACRFTIKHTREIIVGVGPSSYHNPRAASAFAGTLNKVNILIYISSTRVYNSIYYAQYIR
jgi:3-deoxy-D-arabino-heptulosonate 7-phosphate (DAHP) synthase